MYQLQNIYFKSLTTLMMEAVSTSETTVNFYHTARRNFPEDSHLQNIKMADP
jgi:hypothetical protein